MDNLEPILQKILLSLEASVTGQESLLESLQSINQNISKVQESLSGYRRSSEQSAKATDNLSKSIGDYSKQASLASKATANLWNGMVSLGKAARSIVTGGFALAGTAAGVFAVSIKQTGTALLNYQISSINASNATEKLIQSYKGITASGAQSIVSIQQLAKELTKFQTKGLVERIAASSEDFKKGFEGSLDVLTRVVGRDEAGQIFSQFTETLSNQFTTLTSTIKDKFAPLTEIMSKSLTQFETSPTLELQIQGKNEYIATAKKMVEVLENLKLVAADPGQIENFANVIRTSIENVESKSHGSISTITSLNDVYSRFLTIVETAQLKLLETFGPQIASGIQSIGKWINTSLVDIVKKLFVQLDKLSQWINNNKQTFINAFSLVSDTIKQVVSWVGKLISHYDSLSDTNKSVINHVLALGAAFTFVPGLAKGIVLLSQSIIGLGISSLKAVVGPEKLLAAIKAIAGTGLRGGIGAALGIGGAIVGTKAANVAMEKLGVNTQGTISSISRIAGAAAGAATGVALIFPPLAPAAGLIAGIITATQELSTAWSSASEAIEKAKVSIEGVHKSANKLRAQARKQKETALIPIDKLKAEKTELDAILSDLEADKSSEKMDGVWFGFKIYTPDTGEIDKKIEETRNKIQEKVNAIAEIDKQSILPEIQIPTAITEQLSRLEEKSSTIKDTLQEMGKSPTKVNTEKISQLIEELENTRARQRQLQESGPLLVDNAKIISEIEQLASKLENVDSVELSVLKKRLDELHKQKSANEQKINIIITGYDEQQITSDIISIREEFKSLEQEYSNIETGISLDTKSFDDRTENIKKKFSGLQKKLQETDKSGKFSESIQNLKLLEQNLKNTERAATDVGSSVNKFKESLKDISNERLPRLSAMSSSINSITSALSSLGPESSIAGKELSSSIGNISLTAIEDAGKSVTALKTTLEEAYKLMETDPSKAILTTAEAYESLEKISSILESSAKGLIATDEKRLELVTMERRIREADLQIAQNLYGTPGLAVQSQLSIVKAMQEQKDLMQKQLEDTEKIRKEAQGRGEDVNYLVKQELDLRSKIKSVTAEQLSQVRQLRDGYLDAVQAQAFSAGAFEKIIITQEKNTMRGLQKGIAKYNYLLGQYGEAAGRAQAMPYRFSAQSMGMLESVEGKPLSPEEIKKQNEMRIQNITDPDARSASLEAQRIIYNAVSNTDSLTKSYSDNTDRVVGAIDNYAEKQVESSAALYALKGTPSGETVTGSLSDRFLRQQFENQNRNNYLENKQSESIKKYIEKSTKRSQVDTESPASITSPIQTLEDIKPEKSSNLSEKLGDQTLFDRFLKQSLIYYKKSLRVLRTIAKISDDEKDNFEEAIYEVEQTNNEVNKMFTKNTFIDQSDKHTQTVQEFHKEEKAEYPQPSVTNDIIVSPNISFYPEIIQKIDSVESHPSIIKNYVEIPEIENYVEIPEIINYTEVMPNISIPIGPSGQKETKEERIQYSKAEDLQNRLSEFDSLRQELVTMSSKIDETSTRYEKSKEKTKEDVPVVYDQYAKEIDSVNTQIMSLEKDIRSIDNQSSRARGGSDSYEMFSPNQKKVILGLEDQKSDKKSLIEGLSKKISDMQSERDVKIKSIIEEQHKDFDALSELKKLKHLKEISLDNKKYEIQKSVISSNEDQKYTPQEIEVISKIPEEIFKREILSDDYLAKNIQEQSKSIKSSISIMKTVSDFVSYSQDSLRKIMPVSMAKDGNLSEQALPIDYEVQKTITTDSSNLLVPDNKSEPENIGFSFPTNNEDTSVAMKSLFKIAQNLIVPIHDQLKKNQISANNNINRLVNAESSTNNLDNKTVSDIVKTSSNLADMSGHDNKKVSEISATIGSFLTAIDTKDILAKKTSEYIYDLKKNIEFFYGKDKSEKIVQEIRKLIIVQKELKDIESGILERNAYNNLRNKGDSVDVLGFAHSDERAKEASKEYAKTMEGLSRKQKILQNQEKKHKDNIQKVERTLKLKKDVVTRTKKEKSIEVPDYEVNNNIEVTEMDEKQKQAQIKAGLIPVDPVTDKSNNNIAPISFDERDKEKNQLIQIEKYNKETLNTQVTQNEKRLSTDAYNKLEKDEKILQEKITNYSTNINNRSEEILYPQKPRITEFNETQKTISELNYPITTFNDTVHNITQDQHSYASAYNNRNENLNIENRYPEAQTPDAFEGETGVFSPNTIRTLTRKKGSGNWSSQMRVAMQTLVSFAEEIDRIVEQQNKPVTYVRAGRGSNNIP